MKPKNTNKAFTLIELLVVVAIIGILASVVLASLTSARDQGKQAAIKSDLKNMMAQAEASYLSVTPNNYSTACAGVANMITGINNTGGTAACYSFDNTRWGASAKFNSGAFKNWSVDSDGVVSWDAADTGGGGLITWDAANTACAAAGGRLPSFEELKAFSLTYSSALPPAFNANWYWSSTTHATNSLYAHIVWMSDGTVNHDLKTLTHYARCVRPL